MEASNDLVLTVPQVFGMYGLSAGIGTLLAFLVYRSLAKRSGNWDKIRNMFRKNQEDSDPYVISLEKKPGLVTPALLVGITIGVAFMVFLEIMLHQA